MAQENRAFAACERFYGLSTLLIESLRLCCLSRPDSVAKEVAMRGRWSTLFAALMLATGLILLAGPTVRGDPEPNYPKCSTKCQLKWWFIQVEASKSPSFDALTCHEFTPEDCAWCAQGQCVHFDFSGGGTCTQDGTKTVDITYYPPGSCTEHCPLTYTKYAEAVIKVEAKKTGTWQAYSHVCKSD